MGTEGFDYRQNQDKEFSPGTPIGLREHIHFQHYVSGLQQDKGWIILCML